MHRFAVIGCGRWGPNYIRVLGELPGCEVTACCDPDPQALARMSARFPHLATFEDHREMLAADMCDAVVVATPAGTHRTVAGECLDVGKHVLVEKPLAASCADAVALARRIEGGDPYLMVGHVFRFNAGVAKLRDLVYDGTAGEVRYMHCTRTNLGPVRPDVSVIWDLAAHDLSIILHLLNQMPETVSALSSKQLKGSLGDVAFITLSYGDGVLANIHVSWIDPRKRREVAVIGSNALLEFDDMNPAEPVRISERGFREEPSYTSFGEFKLVPHASSITIPALEMHEPLKEQCRHFVDCMEAGKQPLSDVWDGVRICALLEAAETSAAEHGAPVNVQQVLDRNGATTPQSDEAPQT